MLKLSNEVTKVEAKVKQKIKLDNNSATDVSEDLEARLNALINL